MHSRLVPTAAKFNRVVSSAPQQLFSGQRVGCATSTGRTADPAIHSEVPEEVGATEAIRDVKLRRIQTEHKPTTKDDDPYVPPKSPIQSTPKLETPGVGPTTDPLAQQKRRNSTNSAAIYNISCAGVDLSPWPEEDRETDIKNQRKAQEEDDKEYFKHHKASPLSEIEIADTRKPVSRATDGTVQSDTVGMEGGGVIVWRPEQLDTAEDSLRRATEIFKRNAMRGDPDSPHGRVLRQLRGEYW